MAEETKPKGSLDAYAIPIAIVVAGALIAGTIFFTSGGSPTSNTGTAAVAEQAGHEGSRAASNITPVTRDDHIIGSFDAPVKLVEFSDLECPFCKRFHDTVKQVMAEYGESGQVAWVYRHFPLTNIHPKAAQAAVATECANELAGTEGFWRYLDRYFEVTPSNNQIDLAQLPQIAGDIGLNTTDFEECLASGRHDAVVETQYSDAVNSGGTGTPYSVIIAANGSTFPIFGAQPIEQVRRVVEQALDAS